MHDTPRLLVVAALVWLDDVHLLVQRRSASARFGAGLLELPGGKVERGESPKSGLVRELVEEWGPAAARLQVGAIIELLHHVYPSPGPEVVIAVYDVDGAAWGHAWSEHIALETGAEAVRFAAHDLPVDEFLPADRDFVAQVRARGRRA